MNINELKELIKVIDKTSITELKLKIDDMKLEISKNSLNKSVSNQNQIDEIDQIAYEETSSTQSVEEIETEIKVVEDINVHIINSPIMGTFYASPNPDSPNFVQVGSKVHTDTTLCILEAMKLMNEIKADVEGEIIEILVQNEQLVEYNQPLFKIRLG